MKISGPGGGEEGGPTCYTIILIIVGMICIIGAFFNPFNPIEDIVFYVLIIIFISIGFFTLWMVLVTCPIEHFKLNLNLALIAISLLLAALIYGVFLNIVTLFVLSNEYLLRINIIFFLVLCISLTLICLYTVKIYSGKKLQARIIKDEEEIRIKGLIKTDLYRLPTKIHELRGIIHEKEIRPKKYKSYELKPK
ncbi:MAG: hypothetical protein ACFFAN_20525 [Promethearchaeota archaeon]